MSDEQEGLISVRDLWKAGLDHQLSAEPGATWCAWDDEPWPCPTLLRVVQCLAAVGVDATRPWPGPGDEPA